LKAVITFYDKVPEAIVLRADAQKIQPKILQSKDAMSRHKIDMASFYSRILS
jgi:hypothetical protein